MATVTRHTEDYKRSFWARSHGAFSRPMSSRQRCMSCHILNPPATRPTPTMPAAMLISSVRFFSNSSLRATARFRLTSQVGAEPRGGQDALAGFVTDKCRAMASSVQLTRVRIRNLLSANVGYFFGGVNLLCGLRPRALPLAWTDGER